MSRSGKFGCFYIAYINYVHEENQVINIIREGYKLHGRVLRPTQVVVSKKPNPAEASATQTEDKEN